MDTVAAALSLLNCCRSSEELCHTKVSSPSSACGLHRPAYVWSPLRPVMVISIILHELERRLTCLELLPSSQCGVNDCHDVPR